MSELEILYSPEEIDAAVRRLAQEINRDYQGKSPLLIGMLKGCFVFMADLVRYLEMPLEIDFVQLSSYGRGRKESSGRVKTVQGLRTPVEGRDVIIVEDIVDTGITLDHVLSRLWKEKPSSVKICALFNKPERREVTVPIDYLGLRVPNVFIVGYGLDYDEKYRQLPGLYLLKDS